LLPTHHVPGAPPMATLLHRLGKTAYRRWPYFIAGWMVLLIAVITVAAGFSKPMSDAFTIPGIPSEKAADLQSELFPGSADAMDQARDAGLTVEANGSGSQTQEMGGGSSELIGIGLALVVLLLTFGSFVAAGLPILSAVFGLVVGLTGITALTAFMDVSSS